MQRVAVREKRAIRVLLIEDDPDDVLLIQEMLVGEDGCRLASPGFELARADRLSAGLERLSGQEFDVALLDLSLPDSQGLDTFVRAHEKAPGVPIIVLTGMDDQTMAAGAVHAGAQDYLVKGQVEGHLLARAIRYAIERHKLLAELEEARQREQREREMVSLEQLSRSRQTAVTAGLFGAKPLRESGPDTFRSLAQRYGDLMDLALEQRAYRVEHNLQEKLRSVASEIGLSRAGPRDVVEIHTAALKGKTSEVARAKAQAYIEEGRLMLLELMGYLVSFYRNFSLGFASVARPETKKQKQKER